MNHFKKRINLLKKLFTSPRKKGNNNTIEENNKNERNNKNIKKNIDNNNIKEITLNNNNINCVYSKTKNNHKNEKQKEFLKRIEEIVQKENISEKEKKRVISIFDNFIDFLIQIKKDKEIIKNIKFFGLKKINRIKIGDIDSFIQFKYQSSTPATIANIKIKMRKYIRIYNGEPKLNYKEKIVQTRREKESSNLNEEELYYIIKSLMNKDNYLFILLFYFLYFVGLNFSFISRILIQNFNSSLTKLVLKKGSTKIRHHFPPIITNLLYLYFKKSRTYNSKYFFNDNDVGKLVESRVLTIKKQISDALTEIPKINKQKKTYLFSEFSKLRKSKKLSKNVCLLFNPEYIKLLNNKNIDFKIFKNKESSEKSFYALSYNENGSLNKSENCDISLIFNNEEGEYNGDDEKSFQMNFDDLMKRHETKNEECIYSNKYKKEESNNLFNNLSFKKNEKENLSFISDFE